MKQVHRFHVVFITEDGLALAEARALMRDALLAVDPLDARSVVVVSAPWWCGSQPSSIEPSTPEEIAVSDDWIDRPILPSKGRP